MARLFDVANSEYLATSGAPATGYPLTMSVWVSLRSLLGNEVRYIVGLYDGAERFVIQNNGWADSKFGFEVRASGVSATCLVDTVIPVVDTWYHVTAVGRSSTDREIYVDYTDTNTNTVDINPDPSVDTYIAARPGPGEEHDARIAEPAIWNTDLSDAEVAALAAGAHPYTIRPQNLVAYWPLLRTDQDLVGGYDMTPYNSPTWADHPPQVAYPMPRLLAISAVTGIGQPVWVSPADTADMSTKPTLVFTMPSTSDGNMHFQLQLDKVDSFDGGDLKNFRTWQSQDGWEYHDGDNWQPFPSGGVSNTYCGNQARFTVPDADELY